MRGINRLVISGNVGNVTYTETNIKNDPIVTFMLCSEKEENYTTWLKVSAYGKQALYCKDRIKKGCYVIIDGELTNRVSKGSNHLELEAKITSKIVILDDNKRYSRQDDFNELLDRQEEE